MYLSRNSFIHVVLITAFVIISSTKSFLWFCVVIKTKLTSPTSYPLSVSSLLVSTLFAFCERLCSHFVGVYVGNFLSSAFLNHKLHTVKLFLVLLKDLIFCFSLYTSFVWHKIHLFFIIGSFEIVSSFEIFM